LNTAVFDAQRHLWFTGQNGAYGEVGPVSGRIRMFDAPGAGPYGITVTPGGDVYYASLAGNYIARIDKVTGTAHVVVPPTPRAGPHRIWSDSKGTLWVSEWTAGKLGVYDPATDRWREWRLPGDGPHAYAVYVDERESVAERLGRECYLALRPANRSLRNLHQFASAGQRAASARAKSGRPSQALTSWWSIVSTTRRHNPLAHVAQMPNPMPIRGRPW
jgi:virginiamycin B lyase